MKYLIALMMLFSSQLWAASADEMMVSLQQDWAHIKYEVDEKEREKGFETLVKQAEEALKAHPKSANLMIWNAIILSTYAGEKGGLGALSLVKQAKSLLERSLEIDDKALDGSAYTSLASLYYQVPGWPIGFGDDDKARSYFKKALQLNPNGIDSNFFYGDFLIQQKKKQEAKKVLQQALKAAPRPGREVADKGRKDEIYRLLVTL
ncbi:MULTISPECIES: TRAP transporter TatT component family protein [unclassified Motilimonas]|uniref:tetratricopeptide repeat protein n=1 Tax=unclassified Motilimonas TaxID=2643697 RepID=UPI001E5BC6F4|nr:MULTISPECIES: TRAP transporter TatT component family protein [unclassified Motilimonas]MCE0558160.1 tetratricopeptide repeat protein [Motilimonas sp. E26]MDO6524519.1 TRAP transporter TatT component family protein [Motilimonas sp. 1_MG-2023]